MIASGFKKRIGDRVQIKHNNIDRRIRILDVRDNVIHAEMDTVVNGNEISRGVTFAPATLSAKERLNWLGPPSTPETFAMKYLLLMWSNDPAAAAAIADQCGPLAERFKALAQDRL